MTPTDKQMIRTIETIIYEHQKIIDIQQAAIDAYNRQIRLIKARSEGKDAQ